MNHITKIAKARGRDYITPEDIAEALNADVDPNIVRLDVLEVLGRQTNFGVEDRSLCAFIAFKGEKDEEEKGSD